MQDVRTAQKVLPVDLIEVEADITQMKLSIFKILQGNLVGQQLIE
jgi:hypothetical protein